jgi:hypothetical protein
VNVSVEDVKRLPFANYDIVVYLGVGILALPLARDFIVTPLGLGLPPLIVTSDSDFVRAAFETLYLLFVGYAVGHGIAYVSSYFVERFIHEWLRYPSDVWLSLSNRKGDTPFEVFNSSITTTPISLASILTAAFHLPLWPVYAIVHATGSFGFYTPKLDSSFLPIVRAKVAALQLPTPITHRSRWPKTLEHYVANNSPLGYTRLYNYLVIFGLLRSLAFLLILLTWVRLIGIFTDPARAANGKFLGLVPTSPTFSDWVTYCAMALFAGLMMMAFGKFNRRFFEECVYAFVMTTDERFPASRSHLIVPPK